MSQSFELSHALSLKQSHSHSSGYKRFKREALKAFKKVVVNGVTYYTCNVCRLRECRRLGADKEIGLWFTHFFQYSPHFDDVSGAIFSQRPGEELANFTKMAQIKIFIAHGDSEMLDPSNGFRIQTDRPLEFASSG